MSVPVRVFVYGTLLSGEANHYLLATAAKLAEARTGAAFELYDLGSFPGLVAGGATSISGEIYEVDEPTLAALDRLEDHPVFYQRTEIVLEGGERVWTYLLPAEHVARCPVIASGSWKRRG